MTDRTPKPGASADAASREAADRSLQALDRLRERVEAAAAEIERLRTENADLAERVRSLAALEASGADPDALGVAFDEDPEELRARVQHFIDAIDRMLAEPADEASESTS